MSTEIILKQSPDDEDGRITISIESPTGDKLSISLTHEEATNVAWHIADLVEAAP